jgi:hypothetical protein
MPEVPLTNLGIVRCRDLVQLYYGARMVVSTISQAQGSQAVAPVQLFPADSRRVRYEIIMRNAQLVNVGVCQLGAPGDFDQGNQAFYSIAPGDTIIITRDFTTDLDATTQAVIGQTDTNCRFSTRETFLTPLPVDESV